MKNRYHSKPEADRPAVETRKERLCLMCRCRFMSESAGERVCPRCKGLSVWREGVRWPGSGGGP